MSLIGDFIYLPLSSKEEVEQYQKNIRDKEWNEISSEIPKESSFLDVGCGAGYAMQQAYIELKCKCEGIDPEPGAHGVGRYLKEMGSTLPISQGNAENLPYENGVFEVVYSSHVLEHVNDETKSLKEMARVLSEDGKLIIGMPTATMAWINLFSTVLFTTHIRIYEFFRGFFTKEVLKNFIKIFIVPSHSSHRAKTVFFDLYYYRITNWSRIISREFYIEKTITPYLYPYPDYIQWFKLHKSILGSSSVFFICRKKK